MDERGGDTLLARRLRAAREAAGLTQVALAELTGVTQRNISDLETERRGRRVEPALMRRFAEILGIRVGYLLGDRDEPYDIPGWEDLTEQQRAEIHALVALRGRLNRDLARLQRATGGRAGNAGKRPRRPTLSRGQRR